MRGDPQSYVTGGFRLSVQDARRVYLILSLDANGNEMIDQQKDVFHKSTTIVFFIRTKTKESLNGEYIVGVSFDGCPFSVMFAYT